MSKPNLLFVFADQWRAQALGYAGDRNAITPRLDRLASQSVNFTHAVSGIPVCTPTRACLITGRSPLSHGIFLNDLRLAPDGQMWADAFNAGGYRTGYIGKWHIHGPDRTGFIPPDERPPFHFWHVRECTHDYWDAFYYADTPERRTWKGYDAVAQTDDALVFMDQCVDAGEPFSLMMSWGPPHSPYQTAPESSRRLFDPAKIELQPNVPQDAADRARKALAGYYAHGHALDEQMGRLLDYLDRRGIADNTIVVFWSDHGDMVGSRGEYNKQRPWDESIRVPLLIRWPEGLGKLDGDGRKLPAPIDAVDLMPTLLRLCDLDVPSPVEGRDYSGYIRGVAPAPTDAVRIACYSPFGQFLRKDGGREFRGIRTERYTYVRDLSGPWLLYDNETDPYQLDNLIGKPQAAALQAQMEARLTALLEEHGDAFETGDELVAKWGYEVDETGTIPFFNG